MTRRKKTSADAAEDKFIYSKNQSFENLKAVQEMALNKSGKDGEPAPDISVFLKAEELKGKLCGLYADKDKPLPPVNVMGSVFIDGAELLLNMGSEPNLSKNIEENTELPDD